MKAVLMYPVFAAVLLAAGAATAVSPMPSEIEQDVNRNQFTTMQHAHDTTCRVRITHAQGSSNDMPAKEDSLHLLYFGRHTPRKDVLERVIELSKDNLNEDNVSSVSVDCSFHPGKEGGM